MNLKHENGESSNYPDKEEISNHFLEYNQHKYENLLNRFTPKVRNHIRALPLFFHVNRNLLPGYINNSVPHTVYNYTPDVEAVDHARLFNSKFSYDFDTPAQDHAIEAIYLQDNLKSGKVILWIIHNDGLENHAIELLKDKTSSVCKWLESIKIKMEYHVVTANNMDIAYWGNKFNSIHPDKSLFLDDFYSESILIAGKHPAWWLIPPDKEDIYEEILSNIKPQNKEDDENIIDFGSIANARPQDYLASAIINLTNIKKCPEETWLNILSLCHKLESTSSIDCTSHRIKQQIYSHCTECIQYHDIYCEIINETINNIYGRDKSIVIDRAIKAIAYQHNIQSYSINIYQNILNNRSDGNAHKLEHSKYGFEYYQASEIIFDLTRQAFQWFIKKLNQIDDSIMAAGSGLETITHNLMHQLEVKNSYIPITCIQPGKSKRLFDISLLHNTTSHRDSWSLTAIDFERNTYELRQGTNPVELIAWAVFNRIVDDKTRISVICPYLSVKQTHLADIVTVLYSYVDDLNSGNISLGVYTNDEFAVKDILIINESGETYPDSERNFHLYQFTFTNYGELIFSERDGIDGFLAFVCETLSADIDSGNKKHEVLMHNISSRSNTFINDARNIYNNVKKFVFESRLQYTHFIDIIGDHYYAIVRSNNKLTSYNNITNVYPEEYFKYSGKNILMSFSSDVQNHKILNYLYTHNIYGYLQVFYRINDNISHIYILDENGVLTRFSQPFFDRQSFLNQWLMFLYNTRNRIKSITEQNTYLPNIEICELSYSNRGNLIKTHLNSAMLPSDGRYFDLKVVICGEKGQQSIILKCDDREFSSEKYGNNIFDELRRHLAKNFRIGANNPIYLTDVETPLFLLDTHDASEIHIRDFIKYKRNIEKRLNRIINKQE